MHLGKYILAILLLIGCTSCYRMPTEDDYSVNPMTNSKDFNHEGTSPLMPSVGY